MNAQRIYFAVAISLIVFAVFSRLLPHAPNFAPVAAVAIFGGAILPRRWAVVLPLAIMIVSDLIIGLHPVILYTWGSFALIALLSARYLAKPTAGRVIAASLGASVLFFLVSNLGVWLEGKMYAMNLAGLIECYYMALPFFRNTLAGDIVFTGALFGTYMLATSLVSLRPAPDSVKSHNIV